MKNHQLVREKLFDFARKIRFTGLDGTPIKFNEKNYVSGKLDVFNFRDIGDVKAFLNVSTINMVTDVIFASGFGEHNICR